MPYRKNGDAKYSYEPIGETAGSRISEWRFDIKPQSIRFGQPPKEEKWLHT